MFTCIICRFNQQLDDVAVRREGGNQCVCLRCYGRETGTALTMPKALREQIVAVLTGMDVPA